jgi:hypothetical protein
MLSANLVGPMGFIMRLGSVGSVSALFFHCSALHSCCEKISRSSILIDSSYRRGGISLGFLSRYLACTACCLFFPLWIVIWDIRCGRDLGSQSFECKIAAIRFSAAFGHCCEHHIILVLVSYGYGLEWGLHWCLSLSSDFFFVIVV